MIPALSPDDDGRSDLRSCRSAVSFRVHSTADWRPISDHSCENDSLTSQICLQPWSITTLRVWLPMLFSIRRAIEITNSLMRRERKAHFLSLETAASSGLSL